MYIRRKAYSVAIDENGEEKLFSTTEIMSEEAYLEKLYSENEPEQKEFASVRAMKKQSNAMLDAASKMDIKKLGKVAARINKQGLNKNSEKFALQSGSDKVRKSATNKLEKIGGNALNKEEKKMILEDMKNQQINLGKQNIARGGKGIKFKS